MLVTLQERLTYITILNELGELWIQHDWQPTDGGPMDSEWLLDIAEFLATGGRNIHA